MTIAQRVPTYRDGCCPWARAFAASAAVLVLLSGCERAKTKLDREVDRLCAIDGGVHIYQTVTLPKENFGPDGEVFPQYRGLRSDRGGYGSEYVARYGDKVLVTGDPALGRIQTSIVRLSDQKVLGELIVYKRSGGDMPGPWEPSSYACPPGPIYNLSRQIFVPQEK